MKLVSNNIKVKPILLCITLEDIWKWISLEDNRK